MNLLNKEMKGLREEQTKIREEAVKETEAKFSKVIKELEEKLEAALAVELIMLISDTCCGIVPSWPSMRIRLLRQVRNALLKTSYTSFKCVECCANFRMASKDCIGKQTENL